MKKRIVRGLAGVTVLGLWVWSAWVWTFSKDFFIGGLWAPSAAVIFTVIAGGLGSVLWVAFGRTASITAYITGVLVSAIILFFDYTFDDLNQYEGGLVMLFRTFAALAFALGTVLVLHAVAPKRFSLRKFTAS